MLLWTEVIPKAWTKSLNSTSYGTFNPVVCVYAEWGQRRVSGSVWPTCPVVLRGGGRSERGGAVQRWEGPVQRREGSYREGLIVKCGGVLYRARYCYIVLDTSTWTIIGVQYLYQNNTFFLYLLNYLLCWAIKQYIA